MTWARDLLHGLDPERYPLMCRWVWDRKANTGVIREIWFDDEVDNMTHRCADGYATYLMLREELSQFLTDNGVFRDVIWYVDLLCAKIYARLYCQPRAAFTCALIFPHRTIRWRIRATHAGPGRRKGRHRPHASENDRWRSLVLSKRTICRQM